MTYKEYQQDLMDNYGAIDRTWKLSDNKLIRFDGEGNELYFYDLYHSEKNGFFGALEEVRRFNLVNNKYVVKLNLYQRYKLMSLIGLKKDDITKLNRVKKVMSDYEKSAMRAYSRTVEGGKQVAKAIRNQGPNPVGIIGEVLERKRDTNKGNCEKPRIKPAPTSILGLEKLKSELELQKQEEKLKSVDRYGIEKSKFQQRIEKLAKERLNNSVDISNLNE